MSQLDAPRDHLENLELVPFDRTSPLLREAALIYAIVWGRDRTDSLFFFRHHSNFNDYYGFLAYVGSKAVGCAFGTRSRIGQWWHDKVAEQVGSGHPALQSAWVLTELAVLADYRNQHIGARLHDAILDTQPYKNVLLSTQQDNDGARRFYEAHGWSYLHTGFPFHTGRPPYVIMCRRLEK